MRPGTKVTVLDVAREAGVSRTTASYILSGSRHSGRISSDAKERILAAADRLGYSRDSSALTLQRGYSNTIVLLAVTWELATFYSNTTVFISRAAADRGLTTIVHVAADDEEATSFLRGISSLSPYGLLLIWDSPASVEYANSVRLSDLPLVDMMPSAPEGVVTMTNDRVQGSQCCTSHLIELGHTRIGMILDRAFRWRTTNMKLEGYKRALSDAGIEFDEGLLLEATGFGFEAGYQGARDLLHRRPDLTALMCINDPLAIGAIAAIQDVGLKVPHDVSVAGFGGSTEGLYVRPHLTTVAVPSSRIAEEAVEALVSMRERPGYVPRSCFEPMELVVRESTGPARRSGRLPL